VVRERRESLVVRNEIRRQAGAAETGAIGWQAHRLRTRVLRLGSLASLLYFGLETQSGRTGLDRLPCRKRRRESTA
jgi:hypothetical protein